MTAKKNNLLIDPSPDQCKVLLERLHRDDDKALDIIYNHYFNVARLYAQKFVPFESAQDAAQFTFIQLWKSRHSFQEWKRLVGFIYLTTRNYCLNLLEQESRENRKRREYLYYLATDLIEEDMYALDEVTHLDLKDIIDAELKGKKKKAMLLWLNGYKASEIAKKLKIRKVTAQNYRSLAFSVVRQKVPRACRQLVKISLRIFMLL